MNLGYNPNLLETAIKPGEVRNPNGGPGDSPHKLKRIFESEVRKQLEEKVQGEITKHAVMTDNLIRKAMYGKNPEQAYVILRDTIGEKPVEQVQVEAAVAHVTIDL